MVDVAKLTLISMATNVANARDFMGTTYPPERQATLVMLPTPALGKCC